jgi:hypothetical protein
MFDQTLEEAATQAKQHELAGDVSTTQFPNVPVSISDASLQHPCGFGKRFCLRSRKES